MLIILICYPNLGIVSYYSMLYFFSNTFTSPLFAEQLFDYLSYVHFIIHSCRPGSLDFEDLLKTEIAKHDSLIDSINTSIPESNDVYNMRIKSIVSTGAENSITDITKSNGSSNSSNCRNNALYDWWVNMQNDAGDS